MTNSADTDFGGRTLVVVYRTQGGWPAYLIGPLRRRP
jgi:hypothetical protein